MLKSVLEDKKRRRLQRKKRIRGKISGTAAKPRVTIYKSNRHIYAQAIDDTKGHTLAYSDGKKLGLKANKDAAKKVGEDLAAKLKELKIETIVFDRNGYLYHGVVAAFADSLRENGIKF
ncbi:MAG: 50S ribosomal protein L18 [Epsilonproteobacteria bacterium]|nr:50S ribosomal protein L18 [Campylobacterota bacterium]